MTYETALTGTEKQVAWALRLRSALISDLDRFQAKIAGTKQYESDGFAQMFEEIRSDLAAHLEAKWWIDNHQSPNAQQLVIASPQYQAKKAARAARGERPIMASLMRLLDAVRSLDPIEIERLSSIQIRPANGAIIARFSIAATLPLAQNPDLPDNVVLRGWERWPDAVRQIDWRIPVSEQIRELEDAKLLGNLNISALGDQQESWNIRTHAGSDTERLQWLDSDGVA